MQQNTDQAYPYSNYPYLKHYTHQYILEMPHPKFRFFDILVCFGDQQQILDCNDTPTDLDICSLDSVYNHWLVPQLQGTDYLISKVKVIF